MVEKKYDGAVVKNPITRSELERKSKQAPINEALITEIIQFISAQSKEDGPIWH